MDRPASLTGCAVRTPSKLTNAAAPCSTQGPQWRWAAALGAALALAACGGGGGAGPTAGAGPRQMPPPAVGVVTVHTGPVNLPTELPGRLEAHNAASVRARVGGVVQKRLFTEGAWVRAGQPLFALDAASLEAAQAQASAQLAKAQANLAAARAQAQRLAPLRAAQAVSEQDLIAAQAAEQSAQADVALAQAALQVARINLGYTQVSAPISGRVGRALVPEGALVGPSDATPLALVQQTDPMYVNATQSALEVLQLKRALAEGQLQSAGAQAARVQIVLEDGSVHAQPGRLLFTDPTVDAGTGQISLRIEVPNPKGDLLPGLFVHARLQQARAAAAVLLPQQAVQRGAQGDRVLVVDATGQVGPRPVRLGGLREGQWVITQGLHEGDQVVVDGLQKIRPGASVKAVPWQPAGSAAAAGAAQASTGQSAAPAGTGPAAVPAGAQPAPAPSATASRS